MFNLSYAINLVQMDRSDRSTKNFERYLEYANWIFRDLKFKILPGVDVTKVIPNGVGLAAMPPNYVYYTKVSVDINGCSYTLTVNNKIPIPNLKCGIEVAELCACSKNNMPGIDDFGGQFFSWVPHYRAGQFVGEYFSLGGGNNSAGYFREDFTNRQFVFRGIPRLPITIEYVSDGSKGLDQFIPATAVIPIRNGIHWQLKEHSYGKDKETIAEKQRSKDLYDESKLVLRNLTNTPTIDDFVDVMYAGFQSSPKGITV